MKDPKIIFFGPVGAGKTTAIATITNNTGATTDARISDTGQRRKSRTTVAMDYALLESGGKRIHLYGTPGQERFRFMWEMISTELAHDCSGHIMLLDNTRNHPRKDLEFYLNNFTMYNPSTRLVIGVTGSDLATTPTRADYARWLAELEIKAPLFFIDARRTEDVQLLIDEILQPEIPENVAADDDSLWQTEEEMSLEELFAPDNHYALFTPGLIDEVESIDAVTGTALLNCQNHPEHSSLTYSELKALQAFTAGIPPVRQRIDNPGSVESFSLNTQGEGYYLIMLADNQTLGVHCNGQLSLLSLKQEIDNRLQWSDRLAIPTA